jgi:hypothetical protein
MVYSVHQPQYIPWLGFFDKIDKSDLFVFLDDVQYKHREFQNRNKIRVKEGWIWLTVPVLSARGEKIRDVRIDNTRDWRSAHAKSLKSWYSRAPYFKTYYPFFEDLYARNWSRLADLNVRVIEFFLESLGLKKPLYLESDLKAGGEKTQRIINIGRKLKADVYLSGSGGRDYLDEDMFGACGMKLRYQEFVHPLYRQQFSKGKIDFIRHLSLLDLLFNEGEKSLKILRGVVKTSTQEEA